MIDTFANKIGNSKQTNIQKRKQELICDIEKLVEPLSQIEINEKINRLTIDRDDNLEEIRQFISLQKWQGTVIEIINDENIFIAELKDLTNDQNPVQTGEFLIDDISDDDRDLFKIGAVFYWHICYADTIQGQRERKSIIRFQRKPLWDKDEIENARKDAIKIGKAFGWK